MPGVVVLSLVAGVLLVASLGLMMFLDVAFARVPVRAGGRRPMDGPSLAHRLESTVDRLVERVAASRPAASGCAEQCARQEIRVTTPEALAIVDELQRRWTPAVVATIRERARQHAADPATAHCALRMGDGTCACQDSRPVACRVRCLGDCQCTPEAQTWAETAATGASDVFRDCLDAAGVDSQQYELNSAILHVLATPDASQRWARGERVLSVHSA